jgi:hypothetical protein
MPTLPETVREGTDPGMSSSPSGARGPILTEAANREALMRGPEPSVANRPRGAVASPVPFKPNRIGSALPLIALGILAVAQLFDYVSFMVMVERHGLATELNPIVVALANSVGLVGLTFVKAGAVLFLAFAVLLLMPRRRHVAVSVLAVGVVLGIVGGVSNVMTI